MKLGAAWFGFRDQTYSNYFEMVRSLGLEYVEVPLYWQIVQESTADGSIKFSKDVFAQRRTLAEQAGVKMVSAVAALDLAGAYNMRGETIDESEVQFARAAAYRTIDIADELGLEVVRITEPNIPEKFVSGGKAYMEAYGEVLLPMAEYAQEKNIVIAVENYGLTSEQLNWLLDVGDHPNLGTLYDPCNYMRIKEDPLSALKNVSDRVVYCHLKDTLIDESRNPNLLFPGSRWAPSVAVGEGDIEWEPILAHLATFYDGYMCIEYEIADDVMRGTRFSAEYVQAILNRI